MNLLLAFVLFLTFSGHGEGANILALFPVSTKSHIIAFMPIAETLAERGHRLTMVTPFPSKKPIGNIHEIVIEGINYDPTDDWFERNEKSPVEFLSNVIDDFQRTMTTGYRALQSNKEFRDIIASKTIDLVIIDAILHDFVLPIVDDAALPFVYHSSASALSWTMEAMGVSHEFAYVPAGAEDVGSRMTLVERAINMIWVELFSPIRKRFILRELDKVIQQDYPHARPIAEIERDAQLAILNNHPATAWNRPLPPYVLPIGALHVRPAQPLPQGLETFVNGAEDGFIIFTLGSMIRVSSMPVHIANMFANVFARLPNYRVVWKWENASAIIESLPGNVQIVDWLPQQDLLGHKNARLFITHGGLIGIQEAVYHGVPLLGLPFGNDQKGNVAKAKDEGYALKLFWNDLDESLLFDTIHALLTQPTFRGNATRLSRVMRDELLPGKELAAYWIEHVMRHGAQHLQTRARDLPFHQLYLLDVWLLLACVILAMLFLTLRLLKWMSCKTMPKIEKTD